MPADVEQLRRHLHAFDFPSLLVEELGWNHYHARPESVQVDGHSYALEPAAEKAEFVVYVCGPDPNGRVPPYPIRRKIERQAAKLAFEHMIIFVDAGQTMQLWQWVKREGGKPLACREQEFRQGQRGDALLQRLQQLAFELDEEEGLNISGVALRVQQALDVEQVTKGFYERFKKELEIFRGFIEGITAQGDQEWYASLMLNRMMFLYFVQKQSFLDDDPDYLRNRLRMVQEKSGHGRFQQFYRVFLLRLFHEGLGQPEAERAPDLVELLGRIPYLNGGLFDVHDLERDNQAIQIPDDAFERIFAFFDGYRWHLDERPHRADNEINPDVVGYIFEKYINQKQMGAYYTKEDITGYIARNTVIPFLFEAARKECPEAFAPDSGVWLLLRDNPDRYIYPAVGHGVTRDARQTPPKPLESPFDLPGEIAAGIGDVAKRATWNRSASEEYALPTETWREVVDRRQRHEELRSTLTGGEVQDINDLITLNLDICQFAEDVIVQSEGPELVRAFWRALRDVSVLDPTCGSGAFLFAALNVLEPLYTACLEGMRGFLDDLQWSKRPHPPEALRDFRAVLEQVGNHPNHRYYVLKSIVINNLYGVDIMEEAVEICKLRLFLKLVAQVESYEQITPLPDIDFNIRPGNTLVGFTSLDAVRQAMTSIQKKDAPQGKMLMFEDEKKAIQRIEEEAELANGAFRLFQELQTRPDMDARQFAQTKADLRHRLDTLRDELDRYLAGEYRIDLADLAAYEIWRSTHQPFHWFVEFYGIMQQGGFDVIIGNPPYVEYRDVRTAYTVRNCQTLPCGDLYAFILERAYGLIHGAAHVGMIVPISIWGTDGFTSLQRLTVDTLNSFWVSHFANRPSQLFNGAQKRLTIIIGSRRGDSAAKIKTTRYIRWRREERDALFTSRIQYMINPSPCQVFPASLEKLGTGTESSAFKKLVSTAEQLASATMPRSEHRLYYTRKFGYFLAFLDFIPQMVEIQSQRARLPSELKEINFASHDSMLVAIAALTSSCFFWFWNVLSDCRNLNRRDLLAFRMNPDTLPRETRKVLAGLADKYLRALHNTSKTMVKSGMWIETFDYGKCKPIINEIDQVLAGYYGFTDEEADFIVNYDIKYRMGRHAVEKD